MIRHKIIKAAASVLLAASMLLCTACGEDNSQTGNIGQVTLQPGDVFAVFKIMDYGEITVKLLPKDAPNGVEKFIELAKRGYYDGKAIHRVVPDYVIQGGSLNGDGTDGNVAADEYFPVEVSENARHFYGALCFAKSKSGNYCQFYFVNNNEPVDVSAIAEKIRSQLADETIASRLLPEEKKTYEDYCAKLESMPDPVKEKYKEVGGDFALDGESTVFGQTVEGFDVLEKISQVELVAGNEIDDNQNIDSKPMNAVVIESVEIVEIPLPEPTTTTETEKTKRTKATTTEDTAETTVIITEIGTAPITAETSAPETSPETAEADSALNTTEAVPEDTAE
ncbi:MAG: peptidylprolyl isomerase [Ruminiclostridium sp.]